MKKTLLFVLALMLALSSTALAFDYTRFAGVEGVTVEYDPENPTAYLVKAGFDGAGAWVHFGGHLVVRYLNAGRDEELPLILTAFTTSGVKGARLSIRTDAHRYDVACTDLSQANMTVLDTEATLLVTPASVDMLADVASSDYARITIWNDDPAKAFSFAVTDDARALLKMFLDEYEQEIVPMLTDGSTLGKVYDQLSPVISVSDAPVLDDEAHAILNADYEPLMNGSYGDAVVRLQKALKALDYLNDKADGIYGKRTTRAVRDFQTAAGLTATGVADAETQTELFLAQLEAAQ